MSLQWATGDSYWGFSFVRIITSVQIPENSYLLTKLNRTDIFRDHTGLCQFEKGSLKTELLISSRNMKNNTLLANIFHATLVRHLKDIHFFLLLFQAMGSALKKLASRFSQNPRYYLYFIPATAGCQFISCGKLTWSRNNYHFDFTSTVKTITMCKFK